MSKHERETAEVRELMDVIHTHLAKTTTLSALKVGGLTFTHQNAVVAMICTDEFGNTFFWPGPGPCPGTGFGGAG